MESMKRGEFQLWRKKEDDVVSWFMTNNNVIHIEQRPWNIFERQLKLSEALSKMDEAYEKARADRIQKEVSRRKNEPNEEETIEAMIQYHFNKIEDEYKRLHDIQKEKYIQEMKYYYIS